MSFLCSLLYKGLAETLTGYFVYSFALGRTTLNPFLIGKSLSFLKTFREGDFLGSL